MQTITSQIAFTFVDDTKALAAGSRKIVVALITDMFAAIRAKLMMPIEKIASASDVGGVLAMRAAVKARAKAIRSKRTRSRLPEERIRFDVLGIRSLFKSLHNLT
jgi:hypothetical protein